MSAERLISASTRLLTMLGPERLRELVLLCRIEAGLVEGVVPIAPCRSLSVEDRELALLAAEIKRGLAWASPMRADETARRDSVTS
jgi:hypothetical protein